MINAVISGVCAALVREFGCAVYTEDAVQGGEKPCFVVTCKNPKSGSVKDRYFTERQLIGRRYLLSAGLCVEYYPAASDKREECADVLDKLFSCLEYIGYGDGVIRGGGMQGEFSEDMMNFFVSYDVFVVREEECEIMESITINKG